MIGIRSRMLTSGPELEGGGGFARYMDRFCLFTAGRAARTAAFVLLGAFAGGAAHAGAIEQLNAFTTTTQSARGSFTQRVVTASGKAQRPVSGQFSFQRPGRFTWVFQKPFEQSLIADGENLYLYDKDLNQVTIRKLAGALGASPAEILFGGNDLSKSFQLKETGARDGIEWLEATPKQRDTQFSRIDIGLRDGLPAAMELRDNFGQRTVLDFAQVEKNPRIAPETFRFVPPKGADVLDSR